MSDRDLKWIKAAQHATTPAARRRFTRKHHALKIRDEIAACENCPLSETRINTVPFDNDRPRALAIVGEAPGAMEDKTGVPFVGKSGRLLDRMIEATGNKRSDAVVLNTVACRPPYNRKPKKGEIDACRSLYDKQLDFSGAWVVLLLGASALHQIRPGLQISDARGKPFWMAGRIYIPTYHPAYVLRQPSMKPAVKKDITLAYKIVNGEAWWEPMFLQDLAKPNDKAAQDLVNLLTMQGWAAIDSARLDDRVMVLRDDTVKVPIRYKSLIRYTVQELVRLGELGRGSQLSNSELNTIHLVKHLSGTIVVA